VGSEANCASAMITLNSAVAEALVSFKKRVDERVAVISKNFEGTGHNATFHAIIDVLREDIKTCKPIRFDGNGYSDEWKAEAAKRGLDVETSCPVIFERYLDPESIAMFESLGVMTKKELEARNEVKWETYTKKIQIEARVLGDLSMNHIIPVATSYQSQLLRNVERMRNVFPTEEADELNARNLKLIKDIARRTAAIETQVEELVAARKVANKIEDEHQKAIAYHDTIAPMFDTIRRQIDKLELVVDDACWPLPKYRELLFIR
jgi:glutamine synthetase